VIIQKYHIRKRRRKIRNSYNKIIGIKE